MCKKARRRHLTGKLTKQQKGWKHSMTGKIGEEKVRGEREKKVPIKNENQIRGTQTNWPGLWTLTGHKRNDLLKATHNTQRHTSQTLKWFGFALGEPVMSSTQSENSSFTCKKLTHFYNFFFGGVGGEYFGEFKSSYNGEIISNWKKSLCPRVFQQPIFQMSMDSL